MKKGYLLSTESTKNQDAPRVSIELKGMWGERKVGLLCGGHFDTSIQTKRKTETDSEKEKKLFASELPPPKCGPHNIIRSSCEKEPILPLSPIRYFDTNLKVETNIIVFCNASRDTGVNFPTNTSASN